MSTTLRSTVKECPQVWLGFHSHWPQTRVSNWWWKWYWHNSCVIVTAKNTWESFTFILFRPVGCSSLCFFARWWKPLLPNPWFFHLSKNPPGFLLKKNVDHLLDKPMGFSVSYPLGWPSTNRGSVADEARSPTLIAHDDPTLGFCCRNRRVPPGVIFPLVEIGYCRLGCFINRSHNTFR